MAVTGPWPSQAPYPEHHFSQLFEQSAQRLPDKPALIGIDEKPYTYRLLWEASQKTARFLQDEIGLEKGETVAIYAPNSPEFAIALHGTLLAGGRVTTVNPLYREREIEHQLQDAEAVAVFAAKGLMPTVEEAQQHLPKVRQVYELDEILPMVAGYDAKPRPVEIDPENDTAVLPYSSGTTGLPKGVMLSHYNLTSNIKQLQATELSGEDSVILAFLPFYHIYGLVVLLNTCLANGSTCLVMPRFDPDQTLFWIEKHRVTDFYVVPPALLGLAHHPKLDQHDLSSLRFILSGAAPLPLEVADLGEERFGKPVIQGYGMTETSPTTNTNPIDAAKRGSVGPPLADTEEKIVDPETLEELPAGEVGELLVRGPQVMQGYWNAPEATESTLIGDGWLRTGDISRMDEDGYVYIVDRAKEMIKYKGYQVAPAELEGIVMEHPAVLDAAVVPKPDYESGEVPKAYVVLKEGQEASAQDVILFVEERVAPYKKVRDVEFIDAIPKNPSGKILRRDLIDRERAKGSAK